MIYLPWAQRDALDTLLHTLTAEVVTLSQHGDSVYVRLYEDDRSWRVTPEGEARQLR